MTPRDLVLLSPYRFPAQHAVTLADEDMAAWLNAYTALWHPAALWQTAGPPRVEASYDHETPRPGHVYAVPLSPPSLVSEDWEERVRAAGAAVFRATPHRVGTIANLIASLSAVVARDGDVSSPTSVWLHDLPDATVAPFLGVGLGFLLLATLSDAMEHQNLLDLNEFWIDIQQAVAATQQGEANPVGFEGASSPWLPPLQSAAARLLAARETLYPVNIHLLDLVVLADQNPQNPWPVTVTFGQPVNVIASASALEQLQVDNPDAVASLAEAVKTGRAELCGGSYLEREDPLLPVESQLWNLQKGLGVSRELLGDDVRVFAQSRFGAHPQLAAWLTQHGISRAVVLPSDDAALPAYTSPVMAWSTADGQQLDCFVRKPFPTDSIDTFFNFGHHLFKTTREDHTATLAFIHGKGVALPWYGDLLELSQLATVAGKWTTFTNFFNEATAGDHSGNLGADDFHFDYLSQRLQQEGPVSGFARQLRLRRRVDSCWTFAAMSRALCGGQDPLQADKTLRPLED